MPYNGAKVKRERQRLVDAVLKAKTQPLEYDQPLIEGRITSGFGPRTHPVTGEKGKFHPGIDIAAPEGDPIFATEDGFVSQAQHKSSGSVRGNNVSIKHPDGRETRYEHMSRFGKSALKGGPVKKGDVLGYVGSTGRSTGNHLHYGMMDSDRPVDPFKPRPPKRQFAQR